MIDLLFVDLEENEIRCVKPVEFAVISQRDGEFKFGLR